MNNFARDILIGDRGIVPSPTESTHEENLLWSWKLADWIENMKSWPDLDDRLKKYGHRQVGQLLKQNLYEGLSIHMEYHLLHHRHLGNQLYSEPLLGLTPRVNLMLASHDFITRHCWPRIKWRWDWLPDDSDFLWGLFEYSLCYKLLKRIIEGEDHKRKGIGQKALQAKLDNHKSKKELTLTKLHKAIQAQRNWLEDPWCPKKELASSIRQAKTIATQEEKEKYIKDWTDFFAQIEKDFIPNLYKLVLIHADLHILGGDESLIEPYQAYMNAWDTYRKDVSQSESFQELAVFSPDHEPVWAGKVGRPRKTRGFHSQVRSGGKRGPQIGSKRKECNRL
ncbi:MAG: hypothetical protein LDL41_16350 [Coleofasciculus sp. S288]|nr:hypothetical protein [Coleofasciculus sp. S288]